MRFWCGRQITPWPDTEAGLTASNLSIDGSVLLVIQPLADQFYLWTHLHVIHRLHSTDLRTGTAEPPVVHPLTKGRRILLLAAKQEPNALFCVPNRTSHILLVSAEKSHLAQLSQEVLSRKLERCLLCILLQIGSTYPIVHLK
jgi:hypothetical protein